MTAWTFWWEFNKDPFLNLRERIRNRQAISGDDESLGRGLKQESTAGLSPTRRDQDRVLQTLMSILQKKPANVDLISSALVAIAKIGGDKDYLPLIRGYLESRTQEIQETAALALGISARLEAAPILLALASDNPEGRKFVASKAVSFRTRSFACYGLGLIAHDCRSPKLERRIFSEMKALIEPGRAVRSDIQVAALHAMRLLNPEDTEAGRTLRKDVADYLLDFSTREDKAHGSRVRSHGLSALARIVGHHALGRDYKKGLYKAYSKRKKIRPFLDQSLLQAMGWMCSSEDAELTAWIRQRVERSRNQDARHFGMIALGRIGGEDNRAWLMRRLAKTSKRMDKPWYALSIALLHHGDNGASSDDLRRRSDAATLHHLFRKEKNRTVAAGIAIALGILDYKDASLDILDRLEQIQKHDQPAGYMALALGMMGEAEARPTLRHLVDHSKRRDQLLMQVSIGLGLLGDPEITGKLVALLEGRHTTAAVYGSVATALGFLNNRNSIEPLIQLLKNQEVPDLSRAFAAVSLGLVAEKESLPWNSKIAAGSNYVANFETLTGGSLGVLDIL